MKKIIIIFTVLLSLTFLTLVFKTLKATNLITEVKNQNLEKVRILIKNNVDVNEQDTEGNTALMYAIQEPKNNIVDELIKAKSDIELKNKNGLNALMFASKTIRETVDNVKKLISANAKLDEQDNEGNTALIYAAKNANYKIVSVLLQNKANKNIKNNNGQTATDLASGEQTKKVLKLYQ